MSQSYYVCKKTEYERYGEIKKYLEIIRRKLPSFLEAELPMPLRQDTAFMEDLKDAVNPMYRGLADCAEWGPTVHLCTVTRTRVILHRPDLYAEVQHAADEYVITDEYDEIVPLDELTAILEMRV